MAHVYPFFLLSDLFHSKLFCISASKDSLQKKKNLDFEEVEMNCYVWKKEDIFFREKDILVPNKR